MFGKYLFNFLIALGCLTLASQAQASETLYITPEYEIEGNTQRVKVFLGNQKIATTETDAVTKKSHTYWHHSDHLRSANITTDINSKVVEESIYGAYGSPYIENVTTPYVNNYLYNNKEKDKRTDLYYYGARYYDPSISRFTSIDPLALDQASKGLSEALSDPQQLNAYSYARNNPVKYVDPKGEFIETAWDIANAIFDFGAIAKNVVEIGIDAYQYSQSSSSGASTAKASLNKNVQELKTAVVDLGADAAATMIPFVPAGMTKGNRALGAGGKITGKVKNLNVAERTIKKVDDIKGFTKHGIDQVINRKISPSDIKDTIQNTKQFVQRIDNAGRESFRYIGDKAVLNFNKAKEFVTGWSKKK